MRTHLRIKIYTFLIGIVLAIPGINAEPSKGGLQNEEVHKHLWETKNISAVEVSPDNKHVFVSYSTPKLESSSEEVTSDWSTALLIKKNYKDSESLNEKLYNQVSLDSPSWTPDSQMISYISPGDKALSLWVSSSQDFKPQKIIELENHIVGYRWSPNGKKIAILTIKNLSPDALKFVNDVDKLNETTLYVLDINEKRQVSNLTALKADTVLTNVYKTNYNKSLSWSPDNQHVVYSYNPLLDGHFTEHAQLDFINVTTKEIKTLAKGEGTNLFPYISPNGKYLAYVTNILPENAKNPIRVYGTDSSRVCLVNLESNIKQCLAKTPNENPKLVGWKKDGQAVFVVDQEGNAAQIYELGIDGKSISKFTTASKALNGVHVNALGEFIGYAAGDLQTPEEAYITPVSAFKPEKLTSFSEGRVKQDILVEKVQWKSQDQKFDLEGVFIYPKNSNSPIPLMTILNDYSKTATSLGYVGDFTIYPISLLSLLEKGYGLFIPNRRGTNGYGVKFRQSIHKELGGEEFQDVLSGIDALIEKKKVDSNKLALWGWGYGGYLSAVALTQTDRFKVIIVGSGIANLISQVGTTDNPSLLEDIMGGPFWKDWKTWREKSPISHVKNMNTPTFIQAGKNDTLVDPSQSEELFFPLRTRNVNVQMISYLKQAHTFYEPHIILMGIQDLEVWLEKNFSPQIKSQEKEMH